MIQAKRLTSKSARSIAFALTLFVACLCVGCAQSESMQWAQTAPTIAPQGVRLPVNMGVTTDEPADHDDADHDSAG